MSTRTKKTEPFQSGQQSNARDKGESVKVTSNASNSPSADPATGIDHLRAALSTRGMPLLPSDNHVWTHTTRVEPVGAHYDPRQEYGAVTRTGAGQGVYSYGGAPDKKGGNALGKTMNRVGEKSGYPKGKKMSGGGGKHA